MNIFSLPQMVCNSKAMVCVCVCEGGGGERRVEVALTIGALVLTSGGLGRRMQRGISRSEV